MTDIGTSAQRVIGDLRELAALTSTADGAQRLAWGPVWRDARAWFAGKVAALGLSVETDSAGNNWVTLPGASSKTVIVGSHLDSVPNGGWLDGSLGVLAALEALRVRAANDRPPVTLKLADWADEEGARFGRSLVGSSAAAGSLKVDEVRGLKDAEGRRLADVLADNGVALETILNAHRELKAIDARAYLELHIEQGPVLESMQKAAAVVIGTRGVERHKVRFTGQTAHLATPIPMRRDAFLAAAELALECREIARVHSHPGADVFCTVGIVDVEPKIATAVPGVCEISLDQRAMDAGVLAAMHRDAREASDRCARENGVGVEWKPLWRIDPRPFDPQLLRLCEDAIREETGDAPAMPSGALHDAAEMAPHMPAVMMFAYSSRGLSHCKEEDTPEPFLASTIRAYLRLVDKTVAHVAQI